MQGCRNKGSLPKRGQAALRLVCLVLAFGMIGALGAAPLVRSMLNGVSPRDPLTFVTIALILLIATFVASWIPAHRATRVDPNTALRCE